MYTVLYVNYISIQLKGEKKKTVPFTLPPTAKETWISHTLTQYIHRLSSPSWSFSDFIYLLATYYLFLALPGLRFYSGLSLVAASGGYSLVAELGLQATDFRSCSPWALSWGSIVVAHGQLLCNWHMGSSQIRFWTHVSWILYHWATREVLFMLFLSMWSWNSFSRVWLFCDPMNYTVHGILQVRIPEWVTFPFSRGSSQPRNRTQVSCIAGGFFTNWAIREGFSTGDL